MSETDAQWLKDEQQKTRIRHAIVVLRAILADVSLPDRTRLVLTDAIAQLEKEHAHLVRRWD